MEEQLITFETAKLAKEKGFDVSCENYYTGYIDDNGFDLYNYQDNRGSGFAQLSVNNNDFEYSAPTQSLLQKWIREEHKIHIEVNVSIIDDWYFTAYDLLSKRCSEIPELYESGTNLKETSYEHALEIALFECLNILKKYKTVIYKL